MSEVAEFEVLYHALLNAWNRQDASGMAALFAPNGVQIGFDGSQMTGPAEVVAHLEPIFRDHPTACFVTKVLDRRLIGPDNALLLAVAGMGPRGGDQLNPQANSVQTLVASCDEGTWRIELFQNTPAAWHGRDADRAALTAELQALADQSQP